MKVFIVKHTYTHQKSGAYQEPVWNDYGLLAKVFGRVFPLHSSCVQISDEIDELEFVSQWFEINFTYLPINFSCIQDTWGISFPYILEQTYTHQRSDAYQEPVWNDYAFLTISICTVQASPL